MQKKHYQAYTSALQTSSGTRRVVMLYDGILRFLQRAKDAAEGKRIEERYRALTQASEIIFGLQGCLDFERGGDIAKVLNNFYTNIDLRIFALHRGGDLDEYQKLLHEVKQMRDVWDEIDRSQDQGGNSEAAAAPPPAVEGGVAVSA